MNRSLQPAERLQAFGARGSKVDLHLERSWAHDLGIATRFVDTVTKPMLLETVQSRKIDSKRLITHHSSIGKVLDAYDTFGRAAAAKALNIMIEV